MKQIPVTNSTRFVIVDDHNFEGLSIYKWQHNGVGGIARFEWKDGKTHAIRLANEVLQITGTIDHKDRDGFNNVETNLRPCTLQENQRNKSKSIIATSSYMGVSWNRNKRRWEVSYSLNNKKVYVGTFRDELVAAKAYNDAIKSLYGQFANLNKDKEGNIL
jgi:hypothetical protein